MALLAQMSYLQGLLAFVLIATAGLLIIVILLQKGRGEGLTGAFGGSGGSSAFGAKTGDVFTWITVVMASVFVVLSVAANYVFDETPETPSTVQTTDTTPSTDVGESALETDSFPPVNVVPVEIDPPGARPETFEPATEPTDFSPADDGDRPGS